MACSLAIRNDRQTDRPQRERIEMVGTSLRTRSRLSIAVVGIALGLACGQSALADTTRPNWESGGSGAATTISMQDDEWTQYTALEDQRLIMPIQVNGAPATVAEQESPSVSTRTTSDRSIALIESNEAPVVASQKSQPDFALTQNGRSISLIESEEAPVEVAQSAVEGGYFAIVDEQGNAVVPELVAAGSNERMASASSASPRMICVACATFQ